MVELIVIALAVWRISSLFVREDGPRDILGKFRAIIGIKFDEYNQPYSTNSLAELFSCVWCLSLWVGVGMTILWLFSPEVAFYLSLPFAFSAVAIIIEKICNPGE
jgi:hypothetical protein